MAFSSEVLSHSPGDANLGFINRKGLVLQDHNERMEIGDVVPNSVSIGADKKTRGEINLLDDGWKTRSAASWKEIPISVGYIRLSLVSESKGSDGLMVRRYSWSPYEISLLTSRAADPTVGINRSKIDFSKLTDAEISALPIEQKQRMKLLLDPAVIAGGNGTAQVVVLNEGEVRTKSLTAERTRVKEITAVAETLTADHPHCAEKIRSITNEAIQSETSLGDYQIRAMKEVLGAKPVVPITMAEIGMDEDEQRSYSMLRGIQSCLKRDSRQPDGLEGEVHKELCKRSGIGFEGFAVPHNARLRLKSGGKQKRDLNVGTFSQGGALVPTDLLTSVIELLRNRMVTSALGIITMGGLSGNVAIPRQTAAGTAYSLAESATLTKVNAGARPDPARSSSRWRMERLYPPASASIFD